MESIFISDNHFVVSEALTCTVNDDQEKQKLTGSVKELVIYGEDTSGEVLYGTPIFLRFTPKSGDTIELSPSGKISLLE